MDLTSLSDIIGVFEQGEVTDALNTMIDIDQIQIYLQKIFEKTANEYPQLINGIVTVDLTLNWLLNIYDLNRTGSIRLLSMKMALTLLCRGNIEEKYRCKSYLLIENVLFDLILFSIDIFSLVTFEYDGRFVADRQRLSLLFQQAIVVRANNIDFRVIIHFDMCLDPKATRGNRSIWWIKCGTECSKLL